MESCSGFHPLYPEQNKHWVRPLIWAIVLDGPPISKTVLSSTMKSPNFGNVSLCKALSWLIKNVSRTFPKLACCSENI